MNQFLKRVFLLSLSLSLAFLLSCGDDEAPLPLGVYDDGVFIINEGNFLEGDASVSHLNYASASVELSVFQGVNSRALGDVAQSAYAYDTLLFVVVNNSNKVEVLNRYSMESLYTIEALLPRYMTVSGGKGYLTEWVSFSDPGRLSIVNLSTGEIESSITVGFGAEDVAISGTNAYVSNSFENTISVVNLQNGAVSGTITLPSPSPALMDIDANGDLWVAAKGGFDENFAPANDGALFKIDVQSNTITQSVEFNANVSGKFALNGRGDLLYHYIGSNVFSIDVNSSSVSTEPFIAGDFTSLYGIGVNPVTGAVFLADSKNFTEDGEIFWYAADGSLTNSFTVGRGPNGFVFNN